MENFYDINSNWKRIRNLLFFFETIKINKETIKSFYIFFDYLFHSLILNKNVSRIS